MLLLFAARPEAPAVAGADVVLGAADVEGRVAAGVGEAGDDKGLNVELPCEQGVAALHNSPQVFLRLKYLNAKDDTGELWWGVARCASL